MSDWTAGYIADIGYTYGYYQELNPLRMQLALAYAGVAAPDVTDACELGFGQGISINFHATATGQMWFGTDFNPGQAAFARSLAHAAGTNALLFDDSFEEFSSRKDLPQFDFIGLHGIWSWISDANRATLIDFIRTRLRIGGVLYASYNILPGWGPMVPLRDMLAQHSDTLSGSSVSRVERIDAALAFAEKLFAMEPKYALANPQLAERLRDLQKQDRHYLAHEYFNKDWRPMPFAAIADQLASAKLQYAASAHYINHVDDVNLSAAQRELLAGITDATFRQTVRDFIVNEQFRKDYWVKGARALTPFERVAALGRQWVVLLTPVQQIQLTVTGALGEATLQEATFGPVIEALSDHSPRKISELVEMLKPASVSMPNIMQALMLLIAKGDVAPAHCNGATQEAKTKTDAVNKYMQHLSMSREDVGYHVSPLTSAGHAVSRIEQLFLDSLGQGFRTPDELATTVWQLFQLQGHRVRKGGEVLQESAENIAELRLKAEEFLQVRLPLLRTLQIA
ncbi:MAG: class I SAM-dependent methyltransferase [Pseudomonadota bacterium]